MLKWNYIAEDFAPASHYQADLGLLGQATVYRQHNLEGEVQYLVLAINSQQVTLLPAELWDLLAEPASADRHATVHVKLALHQVLYGL